MAISSLSDLWNLLRKHPLSSIVAAQLPAELRTWLHVEEEEQVAVSEIYAAVRHLWEYHLRRRWLQDRYTRLPEEWAQVLLVYWADIEPGPGQRRRPYEVVRLLLNKERIEALVGSKAIAEGVVATVAERQLLREGERKKTATYDRWWKKGWHHIEEMLAELLERPRRSWEKDICLPADYVRRERDESALWSHLQETGRVAVIGMPGVGKSVLLAALWNNPRLDEMYSGGKVWVDMREQMWRPRERRPTKRERLYRWIRRLIKPEVLSRPKGKAMSGEEKARQGLALILQAMGLPHVTRRPVEEMLTYLNARLEGGRLLLVIDDVPDSEWLRHVSNISADKLHLVIATHWEAVAHSLGAAVVEIVGMSEEEALALVHKVQKRKGVHLKGETERQGAARKRVLAAVEGHPLLISMLATEVSEPEDWCRLERHLQEEKVRHAIYEYAEPGQSPQATFEWLWVRLPAERRKQLLALGRIWYLSEYDNDAGQGLWCVSSLEAERIWRNLCDRGWVQCVGRGRYRIHMLVWDFLAKKAKGRWRVLRWLREKVQWRKGALCYPLRRGLLPFTVPRPENPQLTWRFVQPKPPQPVHRQLEKEFFWTTISHLRTLAQKPGQVPLDVDFGEIVVIHRLIFIRWGFLLFVALCNPIYCLLPILEKGLVWKLVWKHIVFAGIAVLWYRALREVDYVVWHRLEGSSLMECLRRQASEGDPKSGAEQSNE